jgi:hypothetical protein
MEAKKQLLLFLRKMNKVFRQEIESKETIMKFRKSVEYFTRERKLPFKNVIILILQK